MTIEETTLLRGRVKLLQPKEGFRSGLDAVFLAAAVSVHPGDKVLDIGCGVGSAGLCVLARVENIDLTGIDIQPGLIDLARQNAELNNIADRCRFVAGDLRDDKNIKDNYFDSVLMNPPFQESGAHIPSPNDNKALSHGEGGSGATLEDWIKYAHRKLKQGGYLTLIHRTDRMDMIIHHLVKRRWFGSLSIFPLYPRSKENSKRVIISARKERYAPLALHTGMVLHEEGGSYTAEAKKILEEGQELRAPMEAGTRF